MTAVRATVRVQKTCGQLYRLCPHNRPPDKRARTRGQIELKPLSALCF
jgi:hypothetical protein